LLVNILIIRFALLLVFFAIANLVLANVFEQLTLRISDQVSQLGSITLLSAFSLLLLAGLWMIFRLMLLSVCNYFSSRQRMERRLLFYTSQRNRFNRLFHFKKARLLYISQQKRKRLLKKHDKKSVNL
jgi:hypothetical protein